jgi:tetratricopeptide (TPR) repeat protein
VKKEPSSLKYWKRLAMCYEKSGEHEKLSEVDPHIIELEKSNIKSRQRYANFLMAKKDVNAAYPLFKELAILTPKDANVFKNLFEISKEKGQKDDAIMYLKNYIVLDSTQASYHKELGELLFDKKDFDGALESFRSAFKLNPAIKGFYKKYEKIVLDKSLNNEAVTVINYKCKGSGCGIVYSIGGNL